MKPNNTVTSLTKWNAILRGDSFPLIIKAIKYIETKIIQRSGKNKDDNIEEINISKV